jgi:hypothetical protein
MAGAGPRFRGTLPSSVDAIPREEGKPRPIVEPLFWPWPSEWPDASSGQHPWSALPRVLVVAAGVPQAVSLTLENRGDAPARGRYRLRVVPASAARLTGPRELSAALKPGGRAALDARVTPTGKASAFRIEAECEGEGLAATALLFAVSRTLVVPKIDSIPEMPGLAKMLGGLPGTPVAGNGSPVKATVRLALAGDRLLVRVDAEDAAPARGPNLWDGSSVELFVAPRAGAPCRQLMAAPAAGAEPAVVRLAAGGKVSPAEGVEMTDAATKEGWTLALSVPFSFVGIDPAAGSFTLDLVVSARRPGGDTLWRAHLAGEANPSIDSTGYLRVTTACT